MPKYIENVRDKILTAAERQILSGSARSFSIRRIAADCGIAPGTIYNYFKDAEDLIAQVMLSGWQKEFQEAAVICTQAKNLMDGMLALYDALTSFQNRYQSFYRNYHSSSLVSGFGQRHLQLRKQISQQIRTLMLKFCKEEENLSDLLAETLIACAVQPDLSISDLNAFCMHLVNKEEKG